MQLRQNFGAYFLLCHPVEHEELALACRHSLSESNLQELAHSCCHLVWQIHTSTRFNKAAVD